MANNPQRLNKSLMNSPYYAGFQQNAGAKRPQSPQRVGVVGANAQQVAAPSVRGNKSAKAAMPESRPVLTEKQIKKIEKSRKKERDYFFIMRKPVCFLIFLFCLIMFLVSAGGVITKFVELDGDMGTYLAMGTSVAKVPDNTPMDERGEDYNDKSVYYNLGDYFVMGITSLIDIDDLKEKADLTFFEKTMTALDNADEESDANLPLAKMIFKYAPLTMVIAIVASLIAMITSFLAMFGRRIFKGFGLAAILMLISTVALLLSGTVMMGVEKGIPAFDESNVQLSVFEFSNVMPFITGVFSGAPPSATDLDLTTLANFTAGYGVIIMAAGSVIILLLSFFARKKVSYSIFDK